MGPQFRISSTAFSDGGAIPVKYTCAAGPTMVSPAISWTDAPKGTESFTLIVHDPDAHVPTHLEDITHWVIFDIPGTSTGLEEGVKADAPATVGVQAKNIMGAPSYMGSCAPTGPDHHYTFELFALNTKLNLPAGSTRAEVVKAMDGHVSRGRSTLGCSTARRERRARKTRLSAKTEIEPVRGVSAGRLFFLWVRYSCALRLPAVERCADAAAAAENAAEITGMRRRARSNAERVSAGSDNGICAA